MNILWHPAPVNKTALYILAAVWAVWVPLVQADSAILKCFPDAADIPGWRVDSQIKTFTADNLWEHIDGAADQYLRYGCTDLAAAYYVHQSTGLEVSVEIYALHDLLNAFGVYAAQKPEISSPVAFGVRGWTEEGGFYFFSDKYYYRLLAMNNAESRDSNLSALSALFARKTSGTPQDFPKVFDVFPSDHRVQDSFGYLPDGIWGVRGVGPGYAAQYKWDGELAEALLIQDDNQDHVQSIYSLIRNAMKKRKLENVEEIQSEGWTGFSGVMQFKGPVLCLVKGDAIAFVSKLSTPKALTLAKRILQNRTNSSSDVK